jgi:hypothetical protein
MIPLKPETVGPVIAVSSWKHREFIKVQAAIIKAALASSVISAGDIDENIVGEASAQGVKSNGWNVLRALGIIERVPLSFTDETRGIFGGRICNRHESAKGRWVAVYRLSSRAMALAWLERNGHQVAQPEPAAIQQEMAI